MSSGNESSINHEYESVNNNRYDMISQLEENEEEHAYIDKFYYLGSPYFDHENTVHILASTIRASTFYINTYKDIMDYLFHNSIYYIEKPERQLHIMQVQITNYKLCDDTIFEYTEQVKVLEVITKTFWIKIIQRTWKTICANKKAWTKLALSTGYLHHRAITSQYKKCPFQLKGMLSYLSVNK